MLDIGWWEILVVGMVALVVVGPKELPGLLRTIGRYVGMAKRQADEFRSQFDEALRESEFNELRDEMNDIKSDVTSSMDDAQQSLNKELSETDYDWGAEEKIEPAPEFADDEPTTSFTTPDGEVITKTGSRAAETGPTKTVRSEPAKTNAPPNGSSSSGHAPAADPSPDQAGTTEPTPAAATAPSDDQAAGPRDAETVR